MQFSQLSAHEEWFLIPFSKTTRKNLSKNGFGICLNILGVVKNAFKEKRFLTIFAGFWPHFKCNLLSHLPMKMLYRISFGICGGKSF